MPSDTAPETFERQLQSIKKEFVEQPFQRRIWPEPAATLSLRETLCQLGLNDDEHSISQTFHTAQTHCRLFSQPIVAVMGQLNAGKSSVIASFLSAEGRARVPRGDDPDKGTNRFVYWIPPLWRAEPLLWDAFCKLLEGIYGNEYEMLDDDPKRAAVQYNSGYHDLPRMRIPLIGVDPGLTDFGAALLDCPDVQRRDEFGKNADLSNPRFSLLVKTAQICSAYLIVWSRSQVCEGLLFELLQGIRGHMPKAPLFLLVNKIDPEDGQPDRTRRDGDVVGLVERFKIQDCYGAFHFKIPAWIDFTPPALVERCIPDQKLPQFFALSTETEDNRPERVVPDRFLQNLPRKLPPAELQRTAIASHIEALDRAIADSRNCAIQKLDAANTRLLRVYEGLLELCARRFRNADGSARQLADEAFARALEDSYQETMPWYLLPSRVPRWVAVQVARTVVYFRNQVLEMVGRNGPLNGAIDIDGDKFFLESAGNVAHEMRAEAWCNPEISADELLNCWEHIFREQQRFRLDVGQSGGKFKEELDSAMRECWANMSWTATAGLIVLSLASVVGLATAIVDGGASYLATYEAGKYVATHLWGEVAIGVAGVSLAIAGLTTVAIKHNTMPALAHLFGLACDVFGVPRRIPNQPPPQVRFQKDAYPLPPIRCQKQPKKMDLNVSYWDSEVKHGS